MKIDDWLAGLAQTATPDMDECVAMLGDNIGWLHRLKETEQDPEWHAEGDVHIHTNMVLQVLYQLLADEAQHIRGERRQALILGVLLHDIAKPIRTGRFELQSVERVGAPQHETYGRSYLAFKLMVLPLPFEVIWTVLNLVGEHHIPKRLAVRNSSKADFLTVARQADTELLYWLEVADMRGRICPDLPSQLMYLDEYRMFAEEYQVWGQAQDVRSLLAPQLAELPLFVQDYVYAHALYESENAKINMVEEAMATTYQHREQHAHLVVMCGPSGAGKSGWIAQNYPDYTLISLDELRKEFNGSRDSQANKGQIIQHAKEQLKAALRNKQGVVWDATNLRKDFRSVICTLGRDYHALVSLVVFLLPEKQLFINNRNRPYRVADSVLMKQLDSYQFPLLNEAHQYQVVGEGGRTLFRSGYYQE
ncbi:MAG: Unknown protein [uncultured Thiotrichaceae bacterium]|uniref:HD domain-containing protein n=1 Tax=uncultured Thiotrichaceae bacterium TaxID=298394 RepID=A0A6S6UA55_9GAMM|nr:MAG: Unknown protein [uncultured Thiotrichaceae bacterium]